MEKKYQLNIWIDKPSCYEVDNGVMHFDEFYFINSNGKFESQFWFNLNIDNDLYQNTILFKDKASAENYIEFMSDVRRLRKAFEPKKENYYLFYDCIDNAIFVDCVFATQSCDYYFTKENAFMLLDKYGQEFIKNWILYCK